MREERRRLGGVPARVYDPGRGRGLVLLGHGGGHGKDSPRFVGLSRHLADATGAAVLCIDAVDHGERAPAAAAPGIPKGWHSAAATRMAQDWRRAADAVADLGPPVAYVGFSMGAVFGAVGVAELPGVRALAMVVGGIPSGPWIDDPELRPLLLDRASRLGAVDVLMVNKADDALFPRAGVEELFDAIPGSRKRLVFQPGDHDDWPPELIDEVTGFLSEYGLAQR